MLKILIPIIISALGLIFLFSFQSTKLSDKQLHIVFCDVGQGDAIYIRTPENVDILVDGGRNSKVLDCLSKYMPFWDRELELVFATHPDADHIAGLVNVLTSYRVNAFYTSTDRNLNNTRVFESLKNGVAKQNIKFNLIKEGDRFTLSDGVSIATYWPKDGSEFADTNEYSLVQVLSYGEFDLLLTGDITFQILNTLDLADSYEVFKLPHHGSKTGIDNLTLEKIKAGLAIISAGKNNSYHHPHPSVMNLLDKFGLPYKRTDQNGSIEVISDGKTTKVINN